MGQAKRKRVLGITAPNRELRAVRMGVFPLSDGSKVRLELPAGLDKQRKYDAATALAKVCKQLIEEADAMADDGSGA